MPSAYFDPENEECLDLLPADVRRDEALVALARTVEEDVLASYRTLDTPPGYRPDLSTGTGFLTDWSGSASIPGNVYLAGYAVDPAAADATFARALKREIAEVIRWRWGQHRKPPGVTSMTAGDPGTSKSFDPSLDRPFPPHFGMFLRAYDRRPVAW